MGEVSVVHQSRLEHCVSSLSLAGNTGTGKGGKLSKPDRVSESHACVRTCGAPQGVPDGLEESLNHVDSLLASQSLKSQVTGAQSVGATRRT